MSSKGITVKAVDYIENNIEEKMSLNSISEAMHYSKFHFHRLFLCEMGISVIDYIRKRKIFSSSYLLRTTMFSITDIAFRSGFTNVDTYIRNFRTYYGITPSQYRVLKVNSNERQVKECKSKMMNKYEMIRNCTIEDKSNAIQMLDRMIELSKVAHNNGLLVLEGEIQNDDSIFLKKSIELLLKGTEYRELDDILTNYIISTDLSDYEMLLRVLVLQGTLLLHEGTYPWDVRVKLSSYFGEDFIEILDGKYDYSEELSKFLDNNELVVENNRLVKEIANMNNRVLQRVFRECDIIIIAVSLIGMEKSDKEIIIDNLPQGQRMILSEVINSLGRINVKHIVDANNEIISVIQSLRQSNDI